MASTSRHRFFRLTRELSRPIRVLVSTAHAPAARLRRIAMDLVIFLALGLLIWFCAKMVFP